LGITNDQHQVGERARRDADDLDVLPLLGRRNDRSGRDVAEAEIAGHGVADRAAAAGTGNDAADIEAVLLEQSLLARNAVRRAGGIVVVLGHEQIGRFDRPSRSKAERNDEDNTPEGHSRVLPAITSGAPGRVTRFPA
jgi:hypothetical protein